MVEHPTFNRRVRGSIPRGGTQSSKTCGEFNYGASQSSDGPLGISAERVMRWMK